MTVTPIENLGQSIPEAGRIRIGVRTDRGAPRSIDTFRFTSTNEAAIREIATLYGGDVRPWNPRGSRSEFEVITAAKAIPIILPPNPLGNTPIYELWSGGGKVRTCDGVTMTISRQTPDGAEYADEPCACDARNEMQCAVTTRLWVLLPDIHFAGTWRLESHGWYAAKELPGMVATVQALQQRGFTRALLALDRRSEVKGGQTRNYVVPVVRSEYTVNEIVAGEASLGALASPEAAQPLALPPAPLLDDQVAEAELIDDGESGQDHESYTDDQDHESYTVTHDAAPAEPKAPRLHFVIACRDLGFTDDDRHGIALAASGGRTSSSKDLTADEIERATRMLTRYRRGEVEYRGVNQHGRAVFSRKEP